MIAIFEIPSCSPIAVTGYKRRRVQLPIRTKAVLANAVNPFSPLPRLSCDLCSPRNGLETRAVEPTHGKIRRLQRQQTPL
jgi:hypothetical protein